MKDDRPMIHMLMICLLIIMIIVLIICLSVIMIILLMSSSLLEQLKMSAWHAPRAHQSHLNEKWKQ
jgi:flagellar basal body-associated protein FliL